MKFPAWLPIAEPPAKYVTVLTIHEDDLYPVPAFRVTEDGQEHWRREAEGPEDTDDGRPGKNGPLYRRPTHWMPLPPPPSQSPRIEWSRARHRCANGMRGLVGMIFHGETCATAVYECERCGAQRRGPCDYPEGVCS